MSRLSENFHTRKVTDNHSCKVSWESECHLGGSVFSVGPSPRASDTFCLSPVFSAFTHLANVFINVPKQMVAVVFSKHSLNWTK